MWRIVFELLYEAKQQQKVARAVYFRASILFKSFCVGISMRVWHQLIFDLGRLRSCVRGICSL